MVSCRLGPPHLAREPRELAYVDTDVGHGIDGECLSYYNPQAAASIGFQLGAQVKTEIIMFMTEDALASFRSSNGWEAGVDGSVALVTVGAGGEIDTQNITDPIIGFIFSNKGLMYNLSLEGSKITKLDK